MYPEGDLEKNAKLWYQEVNPSVLKVFWGQTDPVKAALDNMYLIMEVKGGHETAEKEAEAKEKRWKELLCVMETLEQRFGWEEVEGTEVYTKDEKPEHKSRILGAYRSIPWLTILCRSLTVTGEGYRIFDKQGRSDR